MEVGKKAPDLLSGVKKITYKSKPLKCPYKGALLVVGIRIKEIKQNAYLQPKDSGMCGNYAVANLLNIMPEAAIIAFKCTGTNNRKGGTTTKQVAKALKWLGYQCDERMKIVKPGTIYPDYCLIAIGWFGPAISSGLRRETAAHWIAYKKGMVICSGAGIYTSLKEYTETNRGYAYGYLEVKK